MRCKPRSRGKLAAAKSHLETRLRQTVNGAQNDLANRMLKLGKVTKKNIFG